MDENFLQLLSVAMSKTNSSKLARSVNGLEPQHSEISLNTAEQICAFVRDKQNVELKKFLDSKKANPDFDNEKEWSCRIIPGAIAVESGNLEALKIIKDFDRRLLFQKDAMGRNFLFYAASDDLDLSLLAKDLEITTEELNDVDSKGRTVAHIAAEKNNCAFLRFLNSQGADLYVEDFGEIQPIDLACAVDSADAMSFLLSLLQEDDLDDRGQYLKSLVVITIDNDSVDCFKKLLEEQNFSLAKLSEDFYGNTDVPFLLQYRVVENNAAKITDYLIERGILQADQLAQDSNFLTLAAMKKAVDVLNLLEVRDPKFFANTTEFLASAAVGCRSGEVLSFLIWKNPQFFQSEKLTDLLREIAEQENPISLLLPLSQLQSSFQTAIKTHIACDVIRNKRQDLYGFLEHFFTDYTQAAENYRDESGNSLAHIAAETNNVDVLEMMSQHKQIRLDHHNKGGYKPLHLAAALDQRDALKFLFRKCIIGCEDKDKRYSDKWSSLRVAAANNAVNSIKTMIEIDDEVGANSCSNLVFRHIDQAERNLGFSAAQNSSLAVLKFLYEKAVESGNDENLTSFKLGVQDAINDQNLALIDAVKQFAKSVVDEIEELNSRGEHIVLHPVSTPLVAAVEENTK